MKKVAWIAVIFLLLNSTSVFAADTLKIGIINVNKVINESEEGKKAKADLELMIKSKQGAIEEKRKAIEMAKSDIEKQASKLSQDAKKSKEEEVERLVRSISVLFLIHRMKLKRGKVN